MNEAPTEDAYQEARRPMSITLEGRIWWRRNAPFHLQLELEKTNLRERPSGETEVRGVAVRVFRTDGRLNVGDHVQFPLWVCRRGNEPTGPPFIYEDAFASAVYLEAYLAGAAPNCDMAGYEFSVIEAPSDRPVLTPEELEKPRRRRRHFWEQKSGS